jgi:quercetin dioxygenase-like cupin family protein
LRRLVDGDHDTGLGGHASDTGQCGNSNDRNHKAWHVLHVVDIICLLGFRRYWTVVQSSFAKAQLIGDPSKPGPYTIRLKFPAGFKVAPHTHPDSREVTVLSGTWYTGYGEKVDVANLKELPAGSFYTEPANIAHYVEIREPTMIQVSGIGPSGRKFVGPDAPK